MLILSRRERQFMQIYSQTELSVRYVHDDEMMRLGKSSVTINQVHETQRGALGYPQP